MTILGRSCRRGRRAGCGLALVLVLASACARGGTMKPEDNASPAPGATPGHEPDHGAARIEPHSVAFGVSAHGQGGPSAHARSAEQRLGGDLDIIAWFSDWTQPFPLSDVREAAANGWMPAIFWEPWDHTLGPDDERYALDSIASGAHDPYLREWGAAAAQHEGDILLVLAPEMNSDSSSWAPTSDTAHHFVSAWQRVHSVFDAQGADNVKFVWAPASVETGVVPLASVYPGDRWVDAVGMTVFNGGEALPWGGWRSFDDLRAPARSELERLAPEKDVIYASVASTEHGGDKAEWIRSMFDTVWTDPRAIALIWFDQDKETDWRVDSSEETLAAIRQGVAGS
jgi:hypothetical protein